MAEDLIINEQCTIPAHEIEIKASRAGGPGGQYVNKTSSKITLRWNINDSSVAPEIKTILRKELGSKITADGWIVVQASSERSQHHNKERAYDRFIVLLRNALIPEEERIATKPTKHSKIKKQESKKLQSHKKKLRRINIRDIE